MTVRLNPFRPRGALSVLALAASCAWRLRDEPDPDRGAER